MRESVELIAHVLLQAIRSVTQRLGQLGGLRLDSTPYIIQDKGVAIGGAIALSIPSDRVARHPRGETPRS